MKIYLAGPLFSEAEQQWLKNLQQELREDGYNVLWPYELFEQDQISSWGENAATKIMTACRDALNGCDIVVALLDGPQADDGTAWEIGYACAKSIPVVGIRTDLRFGGELPGARLNAMLAGSCRRICASRLELVAWLQANFPARRD